MSSPFPQSNRDPRTVPDVEVPISGNPAHPVNAPGVSVYYSRTDNLVGLNTEQQTQALVDAMRSTGPGKVLLLEANGPRDGSYVDELRRALPAALEQVPAEQRPEIRLFISDGRPVVGSPNKEGQPYNDFAGFLQNLDAQRANSGTVQIDNSQAVARAVPNWNNPAVVDFFIQERVQPAVDLAKELGIRTVVIDDHVGVPPGANMTAFKRVNGLDDRGATNVITGAYDRALRTIEDGGLQTGLSTAAEPQSTLRFGIDMARLAPRSDIVEIQGYRQTPELVQGMTDRLYQNVRDNFEQYRGVDEFKVALATRANGVNLSENTLVAQQRIIDNFEDRLGDLYRSRGAEPPKVTTSLWAHQHFHEEATLRLEDRGTRVKELQEALNTAGIRVDGERLPGTDYYGQMTRQAVIQFQEQQGLPASGVADKNTQVALGIYPGLRFAAPEPVQTTPAPTPTTEQPTTPVTPAPVQTQPNPPVAPPAAEQPTTPVTPAPVQTQPNPPVAPPAAEQPTTPVTPAPVQTQPNPPVAPPAAEQPTTPVTPAPVQTQPNAPVDAGQQIPAGLYREGDSGEGVRALQEALRRNGAQIEADGRFGPRTEGAVMEYQRANGLQADGIAGQQTIAKLNESLQQTAQAPAQPQPAPGADTVTKPVVNGEVVFEAPNAPPPMQTAQQPQPPATSLTAEQPLSPPAPVQPPLQPQTPVTPPTAEQPLSPPAPVQTAQQPQPPVTSPTAEQPLSPPAPVQSASQVPPMVSALQQEGVMMQGAQGQDVAALQRQLGALGYTGPNGQPLAATGTFDAPTLHAVQTFEKDAGLPQNGVVGPQTIEALGRTQSAQEAVTRDPLYAQAQDALKRLPEGTFANERELNNTAGTFVYEARVAGMAAIGKIEPNARGEGLIAYETATNDPLQNRAYVDKDQARSQTLLESGGMMQSDGLAQTARAEPAPGQAQARANEQQANPVLMTQNTQEQEQQQRSAMRMA